MRAHWRHEEPSLCQTRFSSTDPVKGLRVCRRGGPVKSFNSLYSKQYNHRPEQDLRGLRTPDTWPWGNTSWIHAPHVRNAFDGIPNAFFNPAAPIIKPNASPLQF
jgi:hypothetical protein